MRKQKILTGTAAAIGMLILILDSKTALLGAAQGIDLCIKTVIPSLFPFILLSILITEGFSGMSMSFLRPVSKLFSMPKGTEAILVPAFFGGYPIGAQCIGTAFRAGSITKANAQKLLAFCSNAGPSFLFGMVGAMFPDKWMAWGLWGIQIISTWMVSTLFPCEADTQSFKAIQDSQTFPMKTALVSMATICGWVIIFRVVIGFGDRWVLWILPREARVAVLGMLELSNGCCELASIENVSLRFVLASGLLSFGGICVLMQTISVVRGLSIKYYLIGKGLQSLFSVLLAAAIVHRTFHLLPLFLCLFLIIPRKIRKTSSNPLSVGV